MAKLDEIESRIRNEVAKCKGVLPADIGLDDPVVEDIGLHGDDFTEIAAYLHGHYDVRPPLNVYKAGMTIKDWAKIISDASRK
ncbi:acyl carrier protein [Sphingomonas alba]|uniref:Carrier domain-containing protein n=1 Tax=Sphingomonas alba TaxID=2908208 RepID=A0ABT0RJT1_9SPHN|nr:hypothetical protein [Sphingomonas alba]MCL6682883.1 hypothetical protein [Sphingomonas alba]